MSVKRSASSSPKRLVARQSSYNASVTLYESAPGPSSATKAELEDLEAERCVTETPRRSKRARVKLEPDVVDIEDTIRVASTSSESPKKSKVRKAGASSSIPSPKKPKPIKMELDNPHPAPENWEETYDLIKEMRKKTVAPVDTMGCDKAQLREIDPKAQRLSTLISLMLSSQTKDEVTDAAVAKLRVALGGSITIEAIIDADENTISECINKVGFWRRKTQYIKQAMVLLRDKFDSDVPKTVDELCSLPGVGPKMSFLCLQSAWNINDGIGVDVHVHRITNRLGWHKPPTKTPEETRLNLQSWLPKPLHPEINHLLVGFGQTICTPVAPRCEDCSLSSGLCPSVKLRTVKTRKVSSKKTLVAAVQNEIN